MEERRGHPEENKYDRFTRIRVFFGLQMQLSSSEWDKYLLPFLSRQRILVLSRTWKEKKAGRG